MSPVGLQTQARDGSRVEFGNHTRLLLLLVTRVLLQLLCVIGADASSRHDDHGVKAGTRRQFGHPEFSVDFPGCG
ncbi:hypothetical protein EJB05_51354, partial [Eragrostis curvula]